MSVMFPPVVRKFHFSLSKIKYYLVARVFEIITHFFAFDAGPDEFGEALGALHGGEGAAGHEDGLHRRHLVLLGGGVRLGRFRVHPARPNCKQTLRTGHWAISRTQQQTRKQAAENNAFRDSEKCCGLRPSPVLPHFTTGFTLRHGHFEKNTSTK